MSTDCCEFRLFSAPSSTSRRNRVSSWISTISSNRVPLPRFRANQKENRREKAALKRSVARSRKPRSRGAPDFQYCATLHVRRADEERRAGALAR
ncbi:hypothetical protein PUN28_007612 [Cardiocondyla obscurior]|uniref:Uncharacterized protein n=1 Tax=Cardiocondyla obscurior TaxID=286306 RepID=A0AAW2G4I1_9HYME